MIHQGHWIEDQNKKERKYFFGSDFLKGNEFYSRLLFIFVAIFTTRFLFFSPHLMSLPPLIRKICIFSVTIAFKLNNIVEANKLKNIFFSTFNNVRIYLRIILYEVIMPCMQLFHWISKLFCYMLFLFTIPLHANILLINNDGFYWNSK